MKKHTLFLALMMFFIAPCLAENVQPEAARRAAKVFLGYNRTETNGLVDVSAEAGFPNLYIFTTGQSFVVMAGDDCVQPVLGYSLTNGFYATDLPDNVSWWLQGYSDQIQEAINDHWTASDATRRQWEGLREGRPEGLRATTVVNPLIQTTWAQTSPFNNLCPSGSVTGCVATAMAQIMKYWNYPAHGIGWHSYTPDTHPEYGVQTANFNATNYDWTNMINSYSGSTTSAQRQAVATLMYHCGVAVDMDYAPNGSGAGSPLAALRDFFNYSAAIQYNHRSDFTEAQWITLLKSDLDQSRPIFYSGQGTGGHAFICDGYNSSDYFHFNWGWGGNHDGFFSINNLIPTSGQNFNSNQQAVTSIRPSANNANPSNLTCTHNGRNVTLNWSPASGATSYNVYRNLALIGTVNTTTYADIATYGDNGYYVRSVNSAGELSLSTNSVTVNIPYPVPLVDDLSGTSVGDDVTLSWTAPDWCYPATPSATLTYGNGSYDGWVGYSGSAHMYWGHRYPASSLGSYANMLMYKVSFYANEAGPYQLFVYRGTVSGHPQTQVLQQSVSAGMEGWCDIELTSPLPINPSQDLWVFIYDPVGRNYPGTYSFYSGSNANYYSLNPTSSVGNWENAAFLIRTYLSDGTYTYNIYRNGSSIANQVSSTTYNDNNLPNGSYTYYVKTNYYAGESGPSNSVTVQVNSSTYAITTSCDPTNGGTATGGGNYYNGQSCTLTATPATGYTFVNWTKNGTQVSTNASYTFTVTESATYVTHFQLQTYNVTVSADPTNGGSVSGGGTFNHGQSCTVQATPNTGYTFTNWTENGTVVSTNANYTFNVTGNRTLVAHFQLQTYTITATADPTAGGSVTGGGTYNHGATCTLTATPATGYTFINWTKNGTQVSTNASYSFTVTESATYVAHFQLQTYNITVSADPTAGGSVSGGGTYNHGATCTLTATPNTGYTFINWTKNGTQVSTNASYTFTVTESATYVAHFQLQTYNVTVSADPSNSGTVSGGGTYTYGQSCTVQATPSTGYNFINWTENGGQVSTNDTYTFIVTGNRNLVAHFSTLSYVITAMADPAEGGTISGSGGYNYGDLCTLTATVNEGYTFINWTKDGTEVSTDTTYSFTVTETATYVAHFQILTYTVTVSADPTEGGIVTGGGTYTYGQSCTVQVTANPEYNFLNWTENGEVISEEDTLSFIVTGDRDLVAHLLFIDGISEGRDIEVNLYPNPASDKLTIEASQPFTKLEIISASGVLIYSSERTTDKLEIQADRLAPGIYMIRMTVDDGVLVRRFVKK